MRKTFAVALGAALAGGLALAAFSAGATDRSRIAALGAGDAGNARLAARTADKYKGRFRGVPGSKITIKAKTKGGVPTKIKRMSYVGLPANCPETGFDNISGGWTLVGVAVGEDRKFKVVGNDGEPAGQRSSLKFRGKFSADFDKVRGRFQTNSHFPEEPNPGGSPDPLPEETCTSENRRYVAKR